MNFRLKNTFLIWVLLAFPIAYALENTPAYEGSTILSTYEDGYKSYLNESKNKYINSVISNGLEAYNFLKTGPDVFDHCTVVIKSDTGDIIAGATSDISRNKTLGDLCLLHTLWVDEAHRHQGFGTIIMHELLNYVQSKNCPVIQAEAYAFQSPAKEFFESLGFATAATVPSQNVATDCANYIMRKTLNASDVPYEKHTLPIGYNLTLEESWSEINSAVIVKSCNLCEKQQAGTLSNKPYTIFITSPDGDIVAGALGRIVTWNGENTCMLNRLWVNEQHRQHKLGTKIMRELEQYATCKNCQLIQLETYEWQARGFYEKQGYTAIATVSNVEHGTGGEHYYMRKVL